MSNDHDQVSTVAITRSHCTVCCAFGRVFSVLLAALEADIWGSKLAGSAQLTLILNERTSPGTREESQ